MGEGLKLIENLQTLADTKAKGQPAYIMERYNGNPISFLGMKNGYFSAHAVLQIIAAVRKEDEKAKRRLVRKLLQLPKKKVKKLQQEKA